MGRWMGWSWRRVGLFKPAGIHKVVISNPLDLTRNELRRDVLYLPGRNTPVDRPGFDPGALQDDCSSCNDRIPADDGVVHHDSTHPDQNPVLNRTTVDDR